MVTVPVLSRTMVLIGARGLQHLGALDEDAQLGAPAGADHQGGGGGEPERAGAGDDQDGDRRGEGQCQPSAGADPEPESGGGQPDDDGHEDAGDPVGEPLYLGLAVLGVLDETSHLRQLGVGTDAGGADHQPSAGVHRRTDDGVARAHLDGHRLAGEHRGVHCGVALLDHTVGGDLLARTDQELVADGELLGRDPHLVRSFRAVPEDGDVLGAQLEQCPQRGPGPPLRASLEVAAGQDEGRHAGRGLEVDVARAVGPGDGQLERVRHARRRRPSPRTARRATSREPPASRGRPACPSSKCRA